MRRSQPSCYLRPAAEIGGLKTAPSNLRDLLDVFPSHGISRRYDIHLRLMRRWRDRFSEIFDWAVEATSAWRAPFLILYRHALI
jgi:hypothetical protein